MKSFKMVKINKRHSLSMWLNSVDTAFWNNEKGNLTDSLCYKVKFSKVGIRYFGYKFHKPDGKIGYFGLLQLSKKAFGNNDTANWEITNMMRDIATNWFRTRKNIQ